MKIFTNDCVYVQKNDIEYLNSKDISIPVSIYKKVFGDGITIIDHRNRYEFVKYDKSEEMDFFRGLSFILDYDDVKDLSDEEIDLVFKSVTDKRDRIALKYNDMSMEERMRNLSMIYKCELLDFKMRSLSDYILYKQGRLSMSFPDLDTNKVMMKK